MDTCYVQHFLLVSPVVRGLTCFNHSRFFSGLDNISQWNIKMSLITCCLASAYGEMIGCMSSLLRKTIDNSCWFGRKEYWISINHLFQFNIIWFIIKFYFLKIQGKRQLCWTVAKCMQRTGKTSGNWKGMLCFLSACGDHDTSLN